MSHASSARVLTLHTLRLRGVADGAAIATRTGLAVDTVDAELAGLVALDLVEERVGAFSGFALSDDGIAVASELVDHEVATTGGRDDLEAAYAEFCTFNRTLLEICTRWQLRPDATGERQHNDHTDPDHDAAVIADLEAIHVRVLAVLDTLTAVLARFSFYRNGLQTALDRIRAGDHDYFTKPTFPSYHSLWFEFHEDMLITLGLTRGVEME